PRLPELPLNVIAHSHSRPPVNVHGHVRSLPRALGGEILGGISQLANGPLVGPGVVHLCRCPPHLLRGQELRVHISDGELNSLVATYCLVEDYPALRVLDALLHEPPSVSYTLGREQNSLRIEHVQDVAAPPSLLPDEVLPWYLESVDEYLVCLAVEHGFYPVHLEPFHPLQLHQKE